MRKSSNSATLLWRHTIWVVMLAMAVFVMACGDDDSGTDDDVSDDMMDGVTACDEDTEGPTISAFPTSPQVIGTGRTEAEVQLTFSEPVTGVSADTLTIDGAAQVASVEASGSVYTVNLTGLEPGVTHTLTVPAAGVADECGNALGADFTYDILSSSACDSDDQPPVVRSIPASPVMLPAGTTETDIVLFFSEEVINVTDMGLTVDNGASIDAVANDGNEYTVSLTGLVAGTTTLTVPTDVEDTCGNALAETTVEINVEESDTTAPEVTMAMPADMATDVNADTTVVLTWSESIDRASGSVTIDADGATVNAIETWNVDDDVLTLYPDTLPYGSTVTVTASGYTDLAGNAQAADFVLTFTVGADPCTGLKPNVTLESSDVGLPVNNKELSVELVLSSTFMLMESDITVTSPNGGGGNLQAGSLVNVAPGVYTFVIENAGEGEAYEVSVPQLTSANGCSTLAGGSFTVGALSTLPSVSGACPFPPTLTQHHVAADACTEETNSSIADSEPTGFTLSQPGDAFSIGGIYYSSGSDFDYFSFQVQDDGLLATELDVSVVYGCNFSNGGSPGSAAPEVAIYNDAGQELSAFDGNDDYNDIDGTGNFGAGSGSLYTIGPPGLNTYHVRLDDISGSTWCMDFVIYVQLKDRIPLGCVGTPSTVNIDTKPQDIYLDPGTSTASATVEFDNSFELDETMLTVTPTNGGSGALVPGSLVGNGQSYTFQLSNVAATDTYDIEIARVAGLCSTLRAGTIPVTVTDTISLNGMCPLPPNRALHHFANDLCGEPGSNDSLTSSESTNIMLGGTIGEGFSISGDHAAEGGPDYFSFDLNENGTNAYELQLDLAYGCNFTGPTDADQPSIAVYDDNGILLGQIQGSETYDNLDGTGNYGTASGGVRIGSGMAGVSTYHLAISDTASSALCTDFTLHAGIADNMLDPSCAGTTANTTVVTQATTATAPATGNTVISFELSGAYGSLTEADISITGPSTATIAAGSLTAAGRDFSFEILPDTVRPSGTYTVTLAGGSDSCTTFAGGSFDVEITNQSCPLPSAPMTNSYTHPDVCDGTRTATSKTSAVNTSTSLQNAGEEAWISATMDASGSPADTNWYIIDVIADGTSDYTFTAELFYGCGFTGTGTPGAWNPQTDIELDGSTLSIATLDGIQDYDEIDGSGQFGYGVTTFTVPAADFPAGTNSLYLGIDDNVGSNWCMDYRFKVTLDTVAAP